MDPKIARHEENARAEKLCKYTVYVFFSSRVGVCLLILRLVTYYQREKEEESRDERKREGGREGWGIDREGERTREGMKKEGERKLKGREIVSVRPKNYVPGVAGVRSLVQYDNTHKSVKAF